MNKKAREILKSVTNSLHSWVHPDLPEDLSFIKDVKPWLINTSHEFESRIITDTNNSNLMIDYYIPI